MTTAPSHRTDPPDAAPEKQMLTAFLDYHRQTLLWKIAGLDDEALRRALVPSRTTLLGMVKHLAYVERGWFQNVFAGLDVEDPSTENDPDADWRIEPGETAEKIVVLHRSEAKFSRRIVSGAELDDVARLRGENHTLRWILLPMIEETARHNGHADILRELIDGQTGE